MPTLKKLNEDRINITSKILKKDEDFLPISPEFIKDLKDKILLENSALKLSISDYELMCRNDKVLNMMAIALNKPKAKLKKFCKHMTVFKENISKSPKSIANKINGINGPITNLPIGVRSIILEKFAEILPTKYVLLDWIDKDKLDWRNLCENPNAIDLLELEENYDKINWHHISLNPNAIDLLKKNYDKINWRIVSANPNAIKLLKEKIELEEKGIYDRSDEYNAIDGDILSTNTNPNVIKLLKKYPNKINWKYFSENPNAIDMLKIRIEYENNLSSKDYSSLDVTQKINWNYLSDNKNANAIDLLKENQDKINWKMLCSNPIAIKMIKERIAYEETLDSSDSSEDKLIHWNFLSLNSNAIDLLTKKAKNEKTLTVKQIYRLENKDKIDWYELSKNINAIELLRERIKYEERLTEEELDYLDYKTDLIDWDFLSANPNAIDLLKENQDKINWKYFSKNPAIFKAI